MGAGVGGGGGPHQGDSEPHARAIFQKTEGVRGNHRAEWQWGGNNALLRLLQGINKVFIFLSMLSFLCFKNEIIVFLYDNCIIIIIIHVIIFML